MNDILQTGQYKVTAWHAEDVPDLTSERTYPSCLNSTCVDKIIPGSFPRYQQLMTWRPERGESIRNLHSETPPATVMAVIC